MPKNRFLLMFCFAFSLFTLFGCRAKIKSGLYVGTLSQSQNQKFSQSPVSIQLSLKNSYEADLQVKRLNKEIVDTAHISWNRWQDKITLSIPKVSTKELNLERVKLKIPGEIHWRCYQGVGAFATSLCLSKYHFIMNITDDLTNELAYSLSGDFSAEQTTIELEPPHKYMLSDAVRLAQTRSFEVQIEYQRLVQAKEAAKAAYFNLIPHVNYKTLVAASSAVNPKGMLNFVADFIPFVIPSRWLKAKEAGEMRKAEKASLDIIKADLVNQVSGISYTLAQDQMDLSFYEAILARSSAVLAHAREMQRPDSPIIDELDFRLFAINNILEQEILRLKSAVKIDKTAIALSIGLHNPEGVTDLDIQEDSTSIEKAQPLIEGEIAQAAVERSMELEQLNHLIRNAKLQKDEYYFNWADPEVSSSLSVSLSIIPFAAKAQAFINELLKKREQTQAQIMQRAQNAVTNYNYNLERYRKLKTGSQWLSNRVNKIFDDMLSAQSPEKMTSTGPNLQWAFQTYIQTQVNLHSTLARYRIARAQIQRLLLETYYSRYKTKDFSPFPRPL